MLLQGEVGPKSYQDGATPNLRFGRLADAIFSELNGRYYEQVYRGNVFIAALQAGTAITNLNATATGLILTNPAGSGKNLVLLEILLAQTSTAAAATNWVALAANVNPTAAAVVHTTPVTLRNALLGSGASSVAFADSAATLPAAPVVIRALHAPSISATATTAVPPFIKDEVAGAVIVAPGTAISLTSSAAFSAIASFTWAELPI
ncbi:MAG TPA: hypothetical protein VK738_04390 [Terriglobales bacterium]|jgi:hypothetical protein|nr:hypothetical protein [Terriglobales bacterium]